MAAVLRLQIDPIEGKGWLISGIQPQRVAIRHALDEARVDGLTRRVGGLLRQTAKGLAVPGNDHEACVIEEKIGQTLGGAVFEGGLAAELARAEAQGPPVLLLIDTRDPGVRELPWELLSKDSAALPLESCGEAILARLVPGAPRESDPARHLDIRLWVGDPGDPELAAVERGVRAVIRNQRLPDPLPLSAPLREDCAILLLMLCHGEHLHSSMAFSGTTNAPNSILHQHQPLIARTELAVLGVCDSARGAAGEKDGWAARLVHAGARACLAPAGPLRVDAAQALFDGLFASVAAGANAPEAAAAARRSVRALAHPARSARWHRLLLTLGSDGLFPPLFRPAPELPGWPPPGPRASQLLHDAERFARERAHGFLGVEHLLLACAALSPQMAPIRRQAEPAASQALRQLGGLAAVQSRWGGLSPRMERLGARLNAGFELEQLWQALQDEAWPLMNCLLGREGPPTAAATDPEPSTRSLTPPAKLLEVVGGPEDGRRLRMLPGETLGRDATPAKSTYTLYRDSALMDAGLSREHMRWWGDGRAQILVGSRKLQFIELRVGQLLPLTQRTVLVGLDDRA